jgi:dCMP deaminase
MDTTSQKTALVEMERNGMKSDSRPSFEQVYMNFAEAISQRSSCERLQVGTVITTPDFRKVLSIGYNVNAAGLKNGCDRDEPGNCGCLHSEENAVINCDSPRYVQKVIFVTHLPCAMCAKRIINLGNVIRVIFKHDYRKRDSIQVFRMGNIPLYQLVGGELVDVNE